MNKKFITLNNTYYLYQNEKSIYTNIERIGNLSNTYKGEASIQKNINDITENEIINLTYRFN
jgi:hypothetical protein